MKRSEMIDFITAKLGDIDVVDSEMDNHRRADVLLSCIEKEGMRPPSTPTEHEIIMAVMEDDCPSCIHAKWDESK